MTSRTGVTSLRYDAVPIRTGYRTLKQGTPVEIGSAMPATRTVSRASKRVPEGMKGALHAPFEEFSIKTIELLVNSLEKAKPEGATVEVSNMEDTHHSPCMSEMQAIVVQTVGQEGQPSHTHSMYQVCVVCKTAVRVL